jgi:hypothetical protein
LSEFSIDWVVLDGPESAFDQVFQSQVDLVPTPLASGARVYENPESAPLAAVAGASAWQRDGTGFSGPSSSDRALIRVSYSDGWAPDPAAEDWFTSVSAEQGEAGFTAGGYLAWAPYVAAGLLALAIVLIAWGKARR